MFSVRFIQVSKRLRGKDVLKNVSFAVPQASLACIIGENGSGKTTLLKLAAGLYLPDSGIVSCGAEAAGLSIARVVGFANADSPGFYDRLTLHQNLLFFAALHGLIGNSARRRIDRLFEWFDLREADVRFQELSSGARQRLTLARSLLHDPLILLWDEPTRSLDPAHAAFVRDLARDELRRGQGKTIPWSTHQSSELDYLADQVLWLDRGALKADVLRPHLIEMPEVARWMRQAARPDRVPA